MGLSEVKLGQGVGDERQIIVPRKGVEEIGRFLDSGERQTTLRVSHDHVQVGIEDVT